MATGKSSVNSNEDKSNKDKKLDLAEEKKDQIDSDDRESFLKEGMESVIDNTAILERLNEIKDSYLIYKVLSKKKVWKYSFYTSLIFILITYASGFLLTSMANSWLGETDLYIQWGLFIVGA